MRHKKFKEAFSDNTAGIKKKHLFDNLAQKGMCSNMQMDTKWMTKWLEACINVMGLNVDFWTVPILKHTSRYFCAMLWYKFKKKKLNFFEHHFSNLGSICHYCCDNIAFIFSKWKQRNKEFLEKTDLEVYKTGVLELQMAFKHSMLSWLSTL